MKKLTSKLFAKVKIFSAKLMPEIRRFRKNKLWDLFFVVACIIAFLFVISPDLIQDDRLYVAISKFLSGIPSLEYKTTYIESLGSMLGTFLAIIGALWTQHKFDKVAEQKEIKVTATVIYYDFAFAISDMRKILTSYESKVTCHSNVLHDHDTFKHIIRRYRIHVDTDWINNVAKLSDELKPNEIATIYQIYGDLATIKTMFELDMETVTNTDLSIAYSYMYRMFKPEWALVKGNVAPYLHLDKKIESVLNRIRMIADIHDSK